MSNRISNALLQKVIFHTFFALSSTTWWSFDNCIQSWYWWSKFFHQANVSPLCVCQHPIVCWAYLLKKWVYFPCVLPSCLIKHVNSNRTAVHAADQANRLNNNKSNHTLKVKMMLARWQWTCQSSQRLEWKVTNPPK